MVPTRGRRHRPSVTWPLVAIVLSGSAGVAQAQVPALVIPRETENEAVIDLWEVCPQELRLADDLEKMFPV